MTEPRRLTPSATPAPRPVPRVPRARPPYIAFPVRPEPAVEPWDGPTLEQSRPDAVLVDLDGTLLDTSPLWASAAGSLVRAHGVAWLPADDEHVRGWTLPALCAFVVARGVPPPPDEVAAVLCASVSRALRRGLPWRPGARTLLTTLHRAGVPCALVAPTSGPLLDEIRGYAPEAEFALVPDDDEAGADGAGHARAAAALDVPTSRCVALEQSAPGVCAALESGALTYAVDPTVALPLAAAGHPRLRRVDGLAAAGRALLTTGW
jgi:beta-phosphoglucomutase-like phosphatase (HAD superfamily)